MDSLQSRLFYVVVYYMLCNDIKIGSDQSTSTYTQDCYSGIRNLLKPSALTLRYIK